MSCHAAMGCQRLRAQPQVLNGEPVWPEHWGLSRKQVQELLERLQRDPLWHPDNNVYTLVDDFVVPWTRGSGVGYALHANSTAPKEVNVMVSHAWGEHAEDFLRAVLRATTEGDVVYICALANYQAEDGHGPSIMEQIGSDPMASPFRRVLAHIHSCGVKAGCAWRYRPCLMRMHLVVLIVAMMFLCAPVLAWMLQHGLWQYDPRLEPERARIIVSWLPLSAGLCAVAGILHCWHQRCAQIYPGRMLVVPNRQSDIYSRLWCVYEIFVAKHLGIPVHVARTLAAAGRASVRHATCSSQDDTDRIIKEIESTTTFEAIDSAVYITAHKAWWKVVLCSIFMGSAIAFFDLMFGMTLPVCPHTGSLLWLLPNRSIFTNITRSLSFVVLVLAAKCSAYYTMLSVFSNAQGAPNLRAMRHCTCSMMMAGVTILCVAVTLCKQGSYGAVIAGSGIYGLIWTGYGGGFYAYGLVLRHFSRSFRRIRVLYGIVCFSLSIFFGVLTFHLYIAGLLHRPWNTPDVWAHAYRIIANAAAGSFGSFFLPIYIFWHTARWWGFQVKQ